MIKEMRTLLIALLALASCSYSQSDLKKNMIATSIKLMEALRDGDTSAVKRLFSDEDFLKSKRLQIPKDFKLFNRVADKYGMPASREFKMTKGEEEENIVYIDLVKQPDSTLNLRECKLVVYFLPDMILDEPNSKSILYFMIYEVPFRPREQMKIIEAPLIEIEK